MKSYVKLFLEYHNLQGERIICWSCDKSEAVDVHHIQNKGIGGSKLLDKIENLIPLCRICHEAAHNEKLSKDILFKIVESKI